MQKHTRLGCASLYSDDSVEYPVSRPNLEMDPVSLSMTNRGDCPPLPSSIFLATSSLSIPGLICQPYAYLCLLELSCDPELVLESEPSILGEEINYQKYHYKILVNEKEWKSVFEYMKYLAIKKYQLVLHQQERTKLS